MPDAAARAAAIAALALGWGGGAAQGSERQLALGRHLAQECASCHGAGSSSAIPPLAGRDAVSLVQALEAYRRGERTNPAMVSVAQSLDDQQIRALALYFASLAGTPESPGKAAAGSDARPRRR
jgi:cytochrome c553